MTVSIYLSISLSIYVYIYIYIYIMYISSLRKREKANQFPCASPGQAGFFSSGPAAFESTPLRSSSAISCALSRKATKSLLAAQSSGSSSSCHIGRAARPGQSSVGHCQGVTQRADHGRKGWRRAKSGHSVPAFSSSSAPAFAKRHIIIVILSTMQTSSSRQTGADAWAALSIARAVCMTSQCSCRWRPWSSCFMVSPVIFRSSSWMGRDSSEWGIDHECSMIADRAVFGWASTLRGGGLASLFVSWRTSRGQGTVAIASPPVAFAAVVTTAVSSPRL